MSKQNKIVVTHPLGLSSQQTKRLRSLGDVALFDSSPKTPNEWLTRVRDTDIICSGKFGLQEKIYELHDVFISVPFVAIAWIDKDRAQKRNIIIANAPGCNKQAVAEWLIGMMINLLRQFPLYANQKNNKVYTYPAPSLGLADKTVCILGKGNVGSETGRLCGAFGMKVVYFMRGGDPYQVVRDADVVINTLGHNPSTENLLDEKFFNSLKKGTYFLTVTGEKINNLNAMISAIDNGILAGAATDLGDIRVGDVTNPLYRKLVKHPKVLVTPHIAYRSDVAARRCNDIMIDNIEAWLIGKPIHVVQ